jgi:hypothetical protein
MSMARAYAPWSLSVEAFATQSVAASAGGAPAAVEGRENARETNSAHAARALRRMALRISRFLHFPKNAVLAFRTR